MQLAENPPAGFYVYAHRRGDTGEVFYVGKGHKKRATSPHGRNSRWQRVTAKHGFTVEIMADGLSEQEAFKTEAEKIAELREAGAPLCNMTDGGEGPAGRTFSEETKEKMRAAKLGRKLSPEHVEAIAMANRGKKRSQEYKERMSQKVFTAEHRAKISASAIGRKHSPEAIEKIAAAKRGVLQDPEVVKRRTAHCAGKGNPNFSATTHCFVHPEHGERVCTQYELRMEFNVPHGGISCIVSGKAQSVHGWRVMK